MKIVLIIVIVLIALYIIWRILIKWSMAETSLFEQASNAVGFLSGCLKSIFGGKDVRC